MENGFSQELYDKICTALTNYEFKEIPTHFDSWTEEFYHLLADVQNEVCEKLDRER